MKILSIIFKPYEIIINIVSYITRWIPAIVRRILAYILIQAICYICIMNFSIIMQDKLGCGWEKPMNLSTWMLVALLLLSIDRKIDVSKIQWNRLFWLGWLVCFGLMFGLSFNKPVEIDYLRWAILSLTVFPMMWLVWNERDDCRKLFIILARSMVISSFVYVAVNIMWIGDVEAVWAYEHEYTALMTNPNGNGLICIPFFTSALYLLFADKRSLRLIYVLSMSMSTVVIVLSVCRAAELAIITELVIAVIIYFRYRRSFKEKWTLISLLTVLLVAVIFTMASHWLFENIERLDMSVYAASPNGEAKEWVYSNDTLARLDVYSSGRMVTWRTYTSQATMWGNGADYEGLFDYDAGEVFLTPHNCSIDVCYESGIVAFIGYMLWVLGGCVYILKVLAKRCRFRPEYLMAVLAFIGCMAGTMLESHIYPMNTGIVFLGYMTWMPITIPWNDGHDVDNIS